MRSAHRVVLTAPLGCSGPDRGAAPVADEVVCLETLARFYAVGEWYDDFRPTKVLHSAGLATLLFDLLTPDEEQDRANVSDIGLLGGRPGAVTRWLRTQPEVQSHAIPGQRARQGRGTYWLVAATGDAQRPRRRGRDRGTRQAL